MPSARDCRTHPDFPSRASPPPPPTRRPVQPGPHVGCDYTQAVHQDFSDGFQPCLLARRAPADARTVRPVSAQVVSGRIAGTIVNDAGEPVSGAVVIADNKQATPPSRSAVANREGRFGLMSLKAGFWVLLIRAPGYEPLTFTAPVTARPAPPVTLTLVSIPVEPGPALRGIRPASVIAAFGQCQSARAGTQVRRGHHHLADLLGQAPAVTSVQLALARAYEAKESRAGSSRSGEAAGVGAGQRPRPLRAGADPRGRRRGDGRRPRARAHRPRRARFGGSSVRPGQARRPALALRQTANRRIRC